VYDPGENRLWHEGQMNILWHTDTPSIQIHHNDIQLKRTWKIVPKNGALILAIPEESINNIKSAKSACILYKK